MQGTLKQPDNAYKHGQTVLCTRVCITELLTPLPPLASPTPSAEMSRYWRIVVAASLDYWSEDSDRKAQTLCELLDKECAYEYTYVVFNTPCVPQGADESVRCQVFALVKFDQSVTEHSLRNHFLHVLQTDLPDNVYSEDFAEYQFEPLCESNFWELRSFHECDRI